MIALNGQSQNISLIRGNGSCIEFNYYNQALISNVQQFLSDTLNNHTQQPPFKLSDITITQQRIIGTCVGVSMLTGVAMTLLNLRFADRTWYRMYVRNILNALFIVTGGTWATWVSVLFCNASQGIPFVEGVTGLIGIYAAIGLCVHLLSLRSTFRGTPLEYESLRRFFSDLFFTVVSPQGLQLIVTIRIILLIHRITYIYNLFNGLF